MNSLEAKDFGQPEPRFRATLVRREDGLTLGELLRAGLRAPATHGPALSVKFTASEVLRAYKGTGWLAVRVKSSFGGEATMLYEPELCDGTLAPEKDGFLSGILRLRR